MPRYNALMDDGGRHEGPASTSPYPVSRLGAKMELVDVAQEIERAGQFISSVSEGKLGLIAKQIRALQDEAREILDAAKRDLALHHAECAFVKRPGATYHLYERGSGALYLSMLSPAEWGGQPPHRFRGSYRLELDQSWRVIDGGPEDEG